GSRRPAVGSARGQRAPDTESGGQGGQAVQGVLGGQGRPLESGEQVGVGLDRDRVGDQVTGTAGVRQVDEGVRRGQAQGPEGSAQAGVGAGVGGDQVDGDPLGLGQVVQVQELVPNGFGRCEVPGQGGFVDDQAMGSGFTVGGGQAREMGTVV